MKALILPFHKIHNEQLRIPLTRLFNLKEHSQHIFDFTTPDFAYNKDEWDMQQKRNYVENIFLGYSVQHIIVASNYYDNYDNLLLDGWQRLSAIKDFKNNFFPIFNDFYYADFHINLNKSNQKNETSFLLSSAYIPVIKVHDMSKKQLFEFYKQIQHDKPYKFNPDEENSCSIKF